MIKEMKLYFLIITFLFFGTLLNAQIDNKNKSISIPAVETEKDTATSIAIKPSVPLKTNPNNIATPRISRNLEYPKTEFSMFPKEKFGNPGELYEDRIDKNIDNLRLTPEEIEQRNGSTTDQYFGDFRSKAKFVNVVYRDHGFTDGDIIQVRVNDDIIHPRVYLTGGFKGFKLDLQQGFNKIDFVALNQGESGPNTAEFKVVDDKGLLVSHNQWNLATGVKATVIVVKE